MTLSGVNNDTNIGPFLLQRSRLIWTSIAKAGGKGYDNAAPWDLLDSQSGMRQRANWAPQL